MGNRWQEHVKMVQKANPGKALGQIWKIASKSYKKSAKAIKFAITGKSKKRRRTSKRRKAKRKTKKRRRGRKRRT